jgi:sugar phosphate isomerase/epimerase
MKASDVPEANRLLQNVKHVEDILAALPSETLHIQVGQNQIHVSADDPRRPALDKTVTEFAEQLRAEAEAKLKAFNLEDEQKPSEITGFAEDDLPPPVDPV